MFIKGFTLKVHPEGNLIRFGLLLCLLSLVLLTISGRGCPKRKRDIKTGGSNEWAGIAAPSSLTATTFSYSEIRLSWNDNSNNEDGFEIERRIGLSGTYAPLATTTAPFYSDTNNVANGLTYIYHVRAFNAFGDYSDWSDEVSVSIAVWGNISAIAAGYKHSLAIASNGMVWSWGSNYYGQLGFTDYNDRTQPTLIMFDFDYEPFDSVDRISAGGDDVQGYFPEYSISRKTNGTLWVWGNNTYGQLGTGNYQSLDGPFQWNTDTDWSLISAGGFHTTALKNDGTLWTWGRNDFGQLGLGDSTYRNVATAVGTNSDWSLISGGEYYTLGLKTDRTLWAWGLNTNGQLGLEGRDIISRTTPTLVTTETDWSVIDAGFTYSLAIKTTGRLWAWGNNNYGQLGDGTQTARYTPRQISAESDWSMVAGGLYHTIALKSASGGSASGGTGGTIWSWGRNNYGQLGLGNTINRLSPVQVGIQTDWSVIKAGAFYSLGLKSNGTLWAWGQNDSGQLGVADVINRNIPTQVIFDAPYPPGSLLANVVSSTQINLSWTDNSDNEEGFKIERKLGFIGTYEEMATVGINITFWSDISQTGFTPGTYYYYRVRAFNNFGNSSYLEAYTALSGNWAKVGCGDEHTFGIKTSGTLWGWGNNSYGQLGLGSGTPQNRLTPTQICTDTDWSLITSGRPHTVALKINRTLWAWGYNIAGQLGDGTTTTRYTPYKIGMDTDWAKITAGYCWTLGIKTTGSAQPPVGTLWAWGWNGNGQLGLGDSDNRKTPTLVDTESDWVDIVGGYVHSIGRKKFMGLPESQAGTIWAWGRNNFGQLGLGGANIDRWTPTQVGFDSDWVEIAAGFNHTMGRKSTGTIWAWGQNNYSQLGDGTTTTRYTPYKIGTDTDWVEIAAHFSFHTIGRKTSGTLWAWGRNDFGQLGLGDNGEETNRNTPTRIGANTDWVNITTGSYYAISLKTNGTLWTWGSNLYGQLGLGNIIDRNVPTLVGE